MGKSNKLTPEQNQFACQHLSLVKVFLFKNHLDQEFFETTSADAMHLPKRK